MSGFLNWFRKTLKGLVNCSSPSLLGPGFFKAQSRFRGGETLRGGAQLMEGVFHRQLIPFLVFLKVRVQWVLTSGANKTHNMHLFFQCKGPRLSTVKGCEDCGSS